MRIRALAAVAALSLTLTACSGGGSEDGSEDAGTTTPAAAGSATFVGTDSLKWEAAPSEAELGEGSLDVTIECGGAVQHNIVFEGVDDDAVIAECAPGESATGTVEVDPGTYTYYCAIPGHRSAGMQAEIVIS